MKFMTLAFGVWLSLFFLSKNPINKIDDLDHIAFEGVVTDPAGAFIAGARVTARQQKTMNERTTTTDREGRYRLTMLPPGVYQLFVSADGFQNIEYEEIDAPAGLRLRHQIQLNPAAVAEQMTVGATIDPASIDVSRTVVGGTITRTQIEKLPIESRNPLDLIFLLPGVAPPALGERELAEGDRSDNFRRTPEETGVFSLNGGTPFSNNLTIEGLDNNDDRGARERLTPSLHAVEEVQVIANQFSAEYGRASGGRVNLRLRGGANQSHGQAFAYFRDESLNANGFIRNADPARGSRLPYQNHNPGANLGGPIKRDRLFLFGAYEFDYIDDYAEIAALLPIEANPSFPLPRPNGANLGNTAIDKNGKSVKVNDGAAVGLYDERVTTPRLAHTFQSRADFNLSNNHHGFALFTLARQRDERGFPGGRRTLETLRRVGRDSSSLAFSDNVVFSSRLVNQARFQFSRLAPADEPVKPSPVMIIDIDDPRDVIGNANANAFSRRGKLTSGASTLSATDRREDRIQLQETLNYSMASHALRFGGDVQIIRSRFIDLAETTGTFTFASPADFLANRPARFEQRFRTDSERRNTYTGIFIQDDWRLRPNLTLAFGLRWDHESILADWNNFGPRLSLAWDPRTNGKTVIRAGYGIFYNRALLRTIDDFTITSKTLRIDTNNETAQRLLAELRFPNVLKSEDPRVEQLGLREEGFLRRLSPGFRIPESYQASLGFEREIARGFKVEFNYVFNRGLHLWREVNTNAPRLPDGFQDFTGYLVSRDFDNRRDSAGQRPITTTGNADVVRFNLSEKPSETIKDGGRTIVVFGLNNPSTSNSSSGLKAALAAVRNFRPDPNLTQIEELQSRGNSFYHGVSFELQARLATRGSLRASYTLSKLIDDGVVNTSSPLVAGDFRRERSLSLLDARHRAAISGSYEFPIWLGRLNLAGTFNFTSSRPFSIGANGNDRNLDDVDNDRPKFSGNLSAIDWRRPGAPLNQSLIESFSLPAIGSVGNLPRNAGRGPNAYTLNLRLSRAFNFGERRKVELQIEAFNPLNTTVFSFGAEYVDFSPSSLGDFLAPRRTIKPRTMRVGVKFDF